MTTVTSMSIRFVYEEREWSAVSGVSAVGRSRVYVDCPFCAASLTVYLWSLAGSGKNCSCGAKLLSGGRCRKLVEATPG